MSSDDRAEYGDEIQRLTTMFSSVSDPATKQDCASVTVVTPPGEITVEYGAFRDGDVLNVPTARTEHDVKSVADRVSHDPMEGGSGWVVYDVDNMSEIDAAELVLDATGGWTDIKIKEANLRTIETGTPVDRAMNWFTGLFDVA